MKGKRLLTLFGVICLALIVAVMPFVGACAEEAPPTPAPTPTPTPTPTPPTPPVVEPTGEPILIGAVYPMTGRSGRYGVDSVAAATMAVEEINAAGGVLGRPLKVIFTDSRNPTYTVGVAKRYITENKVHFLFGEISSATMLAVSEVSYEYGVIYMSTDAASTKTNIEAFQPYYFRSSNNVYQSAAACALYMKDKPWRKYAYIGPDYEYGHREWEDFWGLFTMFYPDAELTGEFWPKLYEPDYTPYITGIIAQEPEVLVCGFWGGDTVAFIEQSSPYGLFEKMQFLGLDAVANYEVQEALGDTMPLGIIATCRHHLNWPDTKENSTYVAKFRERLGRFPSYAAQGAYVGVYLYAKAMEKAGVVPNIGTDPTRENTNKVVKALETISLKMPEDPEGFESYMRAKTHQIQQVQAVGILEVNTDYPPATRMYGSWVIYDAEEVVQYLTDEKIDSMRAEAGWVEKPLK